MLHMEPGPERAQLGFREAVLSSFDFLNPYGFKPVQQEITFVRFESHTVFVNIYHGRGSFELGVEIGRLGNPGEKVSLHDLIAWSGVERDEGFGERVVFQVSSREGVQEFVPRLATLVEKYADLFLKGEAGAYESMSEASSKYTAQYVERMQLSRIRAKADTAWHQKDYSQVAELYGSMRDDLTNVEAGRLAYAEKHLPGNTAAGSRLPHS